MEAAKQKMIPIPIHEFVSAGVAPVDLYIQLHGYKYVLLAKEGSLDSADRLKVYENKSVDVLYIRESDYSRYASSGLILTNDLLARSEILVSKKAEFLIKSSNLVIQEIDHLGFRDETFQHARVVAQQTLLLIESNPQILNCLDVLSRLSDTLTANAIATSVFSVMIARAMGWNSKATLEKLALGGILHDVGLKQINPEIINKPYAELTFDELQEYESHPFRGMEILRTLTQVPDDVVAIVYEHHENSLGQGFPRKIRDLRMNPLAKVVVAADQFVELVMHGTDLTAIKKTPDEALSHMERVMGQPFNRDVFAALKLVVKNRLKSAA